MKSNEICLLEQINWDFLDKDEPTVKEIMQMRMTLVFFGTLNEQPIYFKMRSCDVEVRIISPRYNLDLQWSSTFDDLTWKKAMLESVQVGMKFAYEYIAAVLGDDVASQEVGQHEVLLKLIELKYS